MNNNQKIVAGVVCAILILILLFPPFVTPYKSAFAPEGKKWRGWSFIASPPRSKPRQKIWYSEIDTSTWLIEYLFVMSIGGIVFYALKDKKK